MILAGQFSTAIDIPFHGGRSILTIQGMARTTKSKVNVLIEFPSAQLGLGRWT
jgi:hypothetical protein